MINNEQFQKLTGVSRDASLDTMEKALSKAVVSQRTQEIKQSLILREMIDTQGWKVKEGAAAVGLTSEKASLLGTRGRILNLCGFDSVHKVYAAILPMSKDTMGMLYDALLKTDTEADALDLTITTSQRGVVAKRLGDNSTEERVEAIVTALQDKGITSPVETRDAIAGVAVSLDIPLPTTKRQGAAQNKIEGHTVPVLSNAVDALTAWAEDRAASTDADRPFAMDAAEVAAAQISIMTCTAALLKAGRTDAVSDVIAEMFALTDEYETRAADRAAHAKTVAFIESKAMGAKANA